MMSIVSTVLLGNDVRKDIHMERISAEETHVLRGEDTVGYLYSTVHDHYILWAASPLASPSCDRAKLDYQYTSRLAALSGFSL